VSLPSETIAGASVSVDVRSEPVTKIIKSPVAVALSVDLVLAGAALWSQWFGAWYARAHGIGTWHFGLREFLLITFVVFSGIGVIALSVTTTRRSRLILVLSSMVLWIGCAYWGFFLWLNIYGS
jgi:hypothetical protein